MKDKRQSLIDVAKVVYLDNSNTELTQKNEFLSAKVTLRDEDGNTECKEYDRVFLHRAFPFDNPNEYISVLDRDSKEIGLIKKLDDFDEKSRALLLAELERKYYTPKINKIISLKELYGFSYWTVLTDTGEMSFTLQDTYRSIMRITRNRVFIVDISGNRYEIPDVEGLDTHSFKKIELYL